MPLPTSRDELKDYCLRRLGEPVIQINVDNEQVEDRIDDAIQFYQDFHFDGVERVYLKHKITASEMTTTAPLTGTPIKNERITGLVTGAKGNFYDTSGTVTRFVMEPGSVDFQDGEGILLSESGSVGTLIATNAIVKGDIDNGYIPVDIPVVSVLKIFPPSALFSGGIFDLRYQAMFNALPTLMMTDLISFDMFGKHLALLDQMFVGTKPIRFNRKQNRAYIDWNWHQDVQIDKYVILETKVALDPEQWIEMYSDQWLLRYATALIKRQWGEHISKFSGVQLVGGVALDGVRVLTEAVEEIKLLEEQAKKEFQEPIDLMIG